ncbi:MAG: LamG domain-containing protein [Sedimentisphaerales bacterium]|nr:LamG domain-containing protein [Sedimentisphaerales bacterium]
MCRRLFFLISLVLLLSISGNVSAQLLARYKFNETSGNTAVDSSIKGNDGIIEIISEDAEGGDPNWIVDGIDGCLGFDGNMDVNLPAEAMGMRSDSGTVAFWMKMAEVTGGINTIWWGGDNTTGGGFGAENEMHIHVETAVGNIWIGGEICFHGQSDPNNFHLHSDPNKGDPAGNEPNNPILVNDNQWHHITCTWGNDDGNAKLFFNGRLLHQMDRGNRSFPLSHMYLGQMANGSRTYRGLLDDVQIYGRALTEQEVQEVMSAEAALTLQASLPLPANNAIEVPRDTILSWTEGDTAVKHNVYFGTNFEDVNEAGISDPRNVLISQNQDVLNLDPLGTVDLDYNQTYYWRVDEIETDGFTIQKGKVWNFTVVNFIVVDDFEDYDDVNNIIYNSWSDYYVNNTGMTVGYLTTPSMEQKIFHSGAQSMPLTYDLDGIVNDGTSLETTGTLFYAETQLQLTDMRDWTVDNVESLSLWFQGSPAKSSYFEENTAAGTYTIAAAGADIWGAADECQFVYKEMSTRNSVSIIAKIESLENTNPYAKAGIMIRDTLEPGSRNVGLFVTPENGTRYQRRVTADDSYQDTLYINDANDPNWAPNWVKLERTSSGLVRAYYSEDGTFTDGFSVYVVSMDFPIYIGLAVTSHDAKAVCEAVFSNVTVTGPSSTQEWTAVDIGIPSNDPQPMYVALNDNAVVYHDDPNTSLMSDWTEWNIDLQKFADRGVNLTNINSVGIGFGDKNNPQADGDGVVYIDDIRLYRP